MPGIKVFFIAPTGTFARGGVYILDFHIKKSPICCTKHELPSVCQVGWTTIKCGTRASSLVFCSGVMESSTMKVSTWSKVP